VRRLEAEAALDDLTGALRRGVGLRLLQGEIDRVRRSGGNLVVAFVDCDDLKQVNDTEGHAAGDRLLQLVASTLRRRLRSYDLVVRYGGDEFICVLSGAGADGARGKLALIGSELRGLLGRSVFSVGLAELDGEDATETTAGLIARADADLYASRTTRRLAP
jgi:diguanylate cyclase (GGDEF)-like protein